MLLIVGAVIVLIAVVIISRMRGRMDAANHGWMSERWLAEQRASHPH